MNHFDRRVRGLTAQRPQPESFPVLPPGRTLDLRGFLRVLARYRLTILSCVAGALTLVGVTSLLLPKNYEAVARLVIDRDSPSTLVKDTPRTDQASYQDYLRTQVHVLEGEALAWQTLEQLRLARELVFAGPLAGTVSDDSPDGQTSLTRVQEAELIERFQDNLRVTAVPNSWVVEVRFYSRDPGLAALVANAHADNFIEYNFRTKFDATRQASQWLSEQLLELRAQAEEADRKLVEFERSSGFVPVGEKQHVETQRLAELNLRLVEAEAARAATEALHRQAEAVQDPRLLPDELLQTLLERLAAFETERARALSIYREAAPPAVRLNRQIAEVEAQVAARRSDVLRRLRDSFQAAVREEKLARQLVVRQRAGVGELSQRLIEHSILKREAATNRQLYDSMLQQLKEAAISSGLRSGNIRLVDPARVPVKPYSPDLAFNLFLALGLSLPLGVALAFVRNSLDDTVRTQEEAEQSSELPTLALVPLADTAGNGRQRLLRSGVDEGDACVPALVSHLKPKSDMAESFRMLRTWLSLPREEPPPRSLLVTSARPAEGKTVTAVNLAVSLAQRNAKVVLVDADLRDPSVQTLLRLTGVVGLGHFLTGEHPLDGLVVSTAIPSLYCIPAGAAVENPAELLANGRMKELLAWLRRYYDYVVLDVPPLLSFADATLLSVLVDGVLLVARSGVATPASLRRSREMLERANAPVLGLVLNGVENMSYHYASGY